MGMPQNYQRNFIEDFDYGLGWGGFLNPVRAVQKATSIVTSKAPSPIRSAVTRLAPTNVISSQVSNIRTMGSQLTSMAKNIASQQAAGIRRTLPQNVLKEKMAFAIKHNLPGTSRFTGGGGAAPAQPDQSYSSDAVYVAPTTPAPQTPAYQAPSMGIDYSSAPTDYQSTSAPSSGEPDFSAFQSDQGAPADQSASIPTGVNPAPSQPTAKPSGLTAGHVLTMLAAGATLL